MAKWTCWLTAVMLVALAGGLGGGRGVADAARILVVVAMPAPSHLIVFTGLTRALAERGHHITLVAPMDKGSKLLPTHNHVVVSVRNAEVDEHKRQSLAKFTRGESSNVIQGMVQFLRWGPQLVRAVLDHPEFRAEVMDKPGLKFDLVVTEAFFLQEAMVALGHKFGAPVVAVNPFGTSPTIGDIMGVPTNPAYTPNLLLGLPDSMTFMERLTNLAVSTLTRLMYWQMQLPQQQQLVQEYFPDAPPLQELLRSRLALTLVNNHFSLGYPVPLPPGVVEVGGMHVADKPKALPEELKELMDAAKEGVVYFSMGSNLLMEFVPREKVDAIFGALGGLEERVLMKWDGPVPEPLPKNIKILDWAPQADILAHPNLRAFVTHGGLLSTQESVYHAVPLVGIPVFADQEFNMRLAAQKGFAEYVEYKALSEQALGGALRAVLGDRKYKEAASRLSALFRSVPQRPVDLAVFWTEYAMRHGGAHLRPASVDLHLHQVLMLDAALALLLPAALLALALRALCRRCCCRGDAEDKKSKRE